MAPTDDTAPQPRGDAPDHGRLELGDVTFDGTTADRELVIYLYRLSDTGDLLPSGNVDGNYLAKIKTVDFDQIRASFGPGRYLVRVKERGGSYVGTRDFTLDPLPGDPTPQRGAAATATGADALAQALAAQLSPLLQRVEAIEARSAGGGSAEQVMRGFELALEKIVPLVRPAPTGDMASTLALIREIRAEVREEGGGRSLGDALVEVGPSLLDALRGNGAVVATTAAPTPSGAPARPAAPSSATAIQQAETQVVAMFVRALQNGRAPEELADAAETLLSDAEVALFKQATPEIIVGRLRLYAARYPLLADSALPQYVERFLARLREEWQDDEDGAGTQGDRPAATA